MKILSQRDPKWSFKTLGDSKHSVYQYGCVVTNIAMSLSWAACYMDPGYLAKYLKFTKDGLLLWPSVGALTCMKLKWRGYKYDQLAIDNALKSKTETCLLNVDGGKHWVLGIYRIPMTTKFLVADPWDGSRKFYSGVVGYSILQKK